MKKLLLIGLLLFSTAAIAQTADRDVLVTPGGTVFAAESEDLAMPAIQASRIITLSVQDGAHSYKAVVPDSLSAGRHTLPALAFDSDSNTLFVVWMHMRNMMSSELLVGAYKDGLWQPTISIDHQAYRVRYNLRLGITRRVSQLQKDGTYRDVPTLLLHALWWEETGAGEEARYALLPVDHGRVAVPEVHSLVDLQGDSKSPRRFDPESDMEILRHPMFLESGSPNSIEILSGDVATGTLRRTTVRPVLDVRIRIPVGKGPGDGGVPRVLSITAPKNVNGDWSGHITALSSPFNNQLVLATVGATSVTYLSFSGESWSAEKSIVTSARLPAEAAMVALAKMVSAD